jgi:hypothetical protein
MTGLDRAAGAAALNRRDRMSVRRSRDLLILDDDLVVATDSVGGIGPKPADSFFADARTVAHFALRVPLLEVICSGASPLAIINNLSVELEPTGRLMVAEIQRLAAEMGVCSDAITGSTEENVLTQATAVGVTVLGRVPPGGLLSGLAQDGDVVLCAGLPISAPRDDVRIDHPDQVALPAVMAAMASGLVHDALPVGSRGLAWEVPQLAEPAGLTVIWRDPAPVSQTDSGGPASCVLFSCAPAAVDQLRSLLASAPVHLVADLHRP